MRVTENGKTRNYIAGAMELFDKGAEEIVLFARGRAINKLVTVAEIIKQRCDFLLDQSNEISCQELESEDDEQQEENGVSTAEPEQEPQAESKPKKFQSILTITLRRRVGQEAEG
jgi:DNA-binding protein Alba